MLGSPLVTGALDGEAQEAFGVAGDTVLTHVVSVPVFGSNSRVIGALMAAKFVSDSIVRAVGRFTNSDIFFYVITRDDELRVTASTDELRRVGDPELVRVAHQIQDAGADTLEGVQQAGAVRDSSVEVEFGGEHFVGRAEPLYTAQGNPIGGFVALRSLERELRDVGFTSLFNTLLFTGALGLLAAILVAFATDREPRAPPGGRVASRRGGRLPGGDPRGGARRDRHPVVRLPAPARRPARQAGPRGFPQHVVGRHGGGGRRRHG
jgi:hypothetical protein